jgi:hypothetical protein
MGDINVAEKKFELFSYQKDLLRKLEKSGLKVTVEPIETSKPDIENKRRLLELAESGAERPETPDQKKRRLLELAESGAERPSKKEGIGLALKRYCCTNSYDADFHKELRTLRPDWFDADGALLPAVLPSTAMTKEELLKLAESGAPRPNSNAWLKYQKNPIRTNGLEEAINAEEIYGAAMEEQRLGRALINYTNKSRKTYDADFDAKIRALRPDWFN